MLVLKKKKKLKSQNYQNKINTPLLAGEHNYCLAAQHSAEAGPLGLVDSSPQLFYSVLITEWSQLCTVSTGEMRWQLS